MFSGLFKNSRRSVKPETEQVTNIKELLEGEAILRKDMIKKLMEEAYSTETAAVVLMNAAIKKEELHSCILELLEEDEGLRRRYKTEFLKMALREEYMSWFLDILSNGEVTDEEIQLISDAVKEADRGRENTISILSSYSSDNECYEMYRVFYENEKLRELMSKNIGYFLADIGIKLNPQSHMGAIARFFPEYIFLTIKSFFEEDLKDVAGEDLLYVLQLATDSKYLVCDDDFFEIKKLVCDNASDVIQTNFGYFEESYRLVWLLEEEFDVGSNKLYAALEEYYENNPLINDYSDGLEVMDEYMMTKAGYELMKDNCYEITADYPEQIFELCDRFPEEDEAFLFRIAREPKNELLRKFM